MKFWLCTAVLGENEITPSVNDFYTITTEVKKQNFYLLIIFFWEQGEEAKLMWGEEAKLKGKNKNK